MGDWAVWPDTPAGPQWVSDPSPLRFVLGHSGMRAGTLSLAIEHVDALLRPAGVRVIAS